MLRMHLVQGVVNYIYRLIVKEEDVTVNDEATEPLLEEPAQAIPLPSTFSILTIASKIGNTQEELVSVVNEVNLSMKDITDETIRESATSGERALLLTQVYGSSH